MGLSWKRGDGRVSVGRPASSKVFSPRAQPAARTRPCEAPEVLQRVELLELVRVLFFVSAKGRLWRDWLPWLHARWNA